MLVVIGVPGWYGSVGVCALGALRWAFETRKRSNVCARRFVIPRLLFSGILGDLLMATTVSVEIPREILQATRMTEEELRHELALHLFEEEKLSFGKARELSGMSVWDFQQLLGSRGIPVHYDVASYEKDRETLKKMGRI